jgi:hypothetical protein
MPIEKMRKESNQSILHRESALIAKLQTLTPHGINVDE